MMNKYNDFSALKVLKKELEKKEPSGKDIASQPKKRSGIVIHKQKEQLEGERAAKERGLCPGCTVTLMDSNDRGILRNVYKDYVEIEIDGLLFKAGFSDFVVNNAEEDSKLFRSIGGRHKRKEPQAKPQPLSNEISVDLHIEKIPSGYDAPKGFELPYQLEYFKSILHKYLRHRGMKISFIHGVGDGILRDAIRKEIDEVYALSCSWTPGPTGVTIVTIR
ncbi:MAG: hypothetical protein PUC61_08550 [Bacteroidales bacterium]|nr:hypothetical protein [Bacteroidales bacterium]